MRTIEAQAAAFREGVESVTGKAGPPLHPNPNPNPNTNTNTNTNTNPNPNPNPDPNPDPDPDPDPDQAGLSLLSPAELKQLWGGHEVDDARLDLWRSRTRVAGVPPLLVGHFWEYLRQSKPAKRAQVMIQNSTLGPSPRPQSQL